MKTLKRLFTWLRGLSDVQVIPPDHCAICGHGANPTTGVPIRTIQGTHLHLACMLGAAKNAQFS